MATRRVKVHAVTPPQTPLLAGALPRVDFIDAFRARIPDGAPDDLDALANAFFGGFEDSPLLRVPMWIRDQVVRPFGLKRSKDFKSPPPYDFRPGGNSPGFKVLTRTDDELLFGENDSHLDFRLSLLVERGTDGAFVTATTVVQFNNWVGRAYFAIVRWGHRIIVPAMMRRALRRLAAAQTRHPLVHTDGRRT